MKFASNIPLALVLAIIIPSTTFASTVAVTPPVVTASSTAQVLSAQLGQISAELASSTPPGTAVVILSSGQSTLQASTTSSGGLLQVSFPNLEYEKLGLSASTAEPVLNFARINLQYLPCVSAFSTSTACIAMASSSFPQMRSDLQQGQDTGYLHYLITLTNLSSTTATLQITDTSVLTNLQNEVNSIAAQVANLIGT